MAQADGLLVVAGLALVDGRVLLGKRKATGKRGGLWECPGGKVDPGENPKDALIREWREELGIHVSVGEYIATAHLEVEVAFDVDLYQVWSSEFSAAKNLDHDALAWFDIHHALEYQPCSPAMYLHYPRVRRWLVQHGW